MGQTTGVIVLASQKGGSGKTTLTGHLAVEAERAGDGPVALIDTDPQGSLAKWWNARAATTPLFARVPVGELEQGIAALRRSGVKLIFIDTPPAVTEAISRVVAHADLVVVPTRPSPHDLRAVGPTVDIVERHRKALAFVVNSATARARITAETAVALSQHGVVAPVTLHHRVDYAASMIDGRTVGEVREGSRSAEEVAALWQYLRGRLARTEGQVVPSLDFATTVLTPAVPADMVEDEDAELDIPAVAARPALRPAVAPAPIAEPALTLAAEPAPPVVTPPPPAPTPIMPPEPMGIEALRALAPKLTQSPPAALNDDWDGVERRGADRGPPAGQADRRKAMSFGRRLASAFR